MRFRSQDYQNVKNVKNPTSFCYSFSFILSDGGQGEKDKQTTFMAHCTLPLSMRKKMFLQGPKVSKNPELDIVEVLVNLLVKPKLVPVDFHLNVSACFLLILASECATFLEMPFGRRTQGIFLQMIVNLRASTCKSPHSH